MNEQLKLTIFLDATSLKSSKCIRKLLYTVHHGYTPIIKNYKMEYGTAGHKFIAHWYKTRDISTSIQIALKHYLDPAIVVPPNDFRTAVHLGMTLSEYATTYDNDPFEIARDRDGKLLIEQRFAIPFYEDDYLRVVLFGVIDGLGTYGGEYVYIDHKFTSAYEPSKYFKLYNLSGQMTTYKYGLVSLAKQYPTTFGQFRHAKCVIDGIFINKTGAKFDRSAPIEVTDSDLLDYERNVTKVCHRISTTLQEGTLPREGIVNGACEGEYFEPCQFFDACSLNEPEVILDANFMKREYSPAIFD